MEWRTIEIDYEKEAAEIEKGLERLDRLAELGVTAEIEGICRGVVYYHDKYQGDCFKGFLECSDGRLWSFSGDWEIPWGSSLAKMSSETNRPVLMQIGDWAGHIVGMRLGEITAYRLDDLGNRLRLNDTLGKESFSPYYDLPVRAEQTGMI